MTLPAPNLDDRRAQDIVDEAKRRLAALVPDWTDHNVSDPGVALIELFAWMTEMILFRLNQVPDRLYVKFLELVGIELFSAAPARGELLFWLTAAHSEPVRVPAGTQVSTDRSDHEAPVVFATESALEIVPPEIIACLTVDDTGELRDHWEALQREAEPVELFPTLEPDDAVHFGFRRSLASNVLRLDLVTGPEGAGVDPDRPPRVWESWDGRAWRPARVLRDTSEGFNSTGVVELLLPSEHQQLPLGNVRAYWVRCRLIEPEPEQPRYVNPPILERVEATCVGGSAMALHAEPAPEELLGVSTGEPGQRFMVRRRPVLPRRPGETVMVLGPDEETGASGAAGLPSVAGGDGRTGEWAEVADFFDARADDRVFVWSGSTGEITFGPMVIDSQGRRVQHGAVPPLDSRIVCTGYRHGGGARGNLGANRLRIMQTSIPLVHRVTNPDPTTGGMDPETVENAKVRGPLTLRGGSRAVTAEDFERAAMDAARGVARASCLPPAVPGGPARLLVVPRVDVASTDLQLDDLIVSQELEARIKAHLEPRRVLTVRVSIDTPVYQGVQVDARVRSAPGLQPELVQQVAERALYDFINPLSGGPSGQGWPFAHDLTLGDVHAVLAGLPGLESVMQVHFYNVDLRRPENTQRVDQRVPLTPGALFLSYQHRVEVTQ